MRYKIACILLPLTVIVLVKKTAVAAFHPVNHSLMQPLIQTPQLLADVYLCYS
jgi:hypothetical protein